MPGLPQPLATRPGNEAGPATLLKMKRKLWNTCTAGRQSRTAAFECPWRVLFSQSGHHGVVCDRLPHYMCINVGDLWQ